MFNGYSLKRLSGCLRPALLKSLIVGSSSRNTCPLLFQAASITSKHFRDRSIKKPAPWPYKEKKCTGWHLLLFLDDTLSRFDENTQLIVVEGNIGSGKTEFAKKLADELEMLYMPEVCLESAYITDSGFDIRTLDPIVPDAYKSYTLKDFYTIPNDRRVYTFQLHTYMLRLEQYVEALAHILNTGQGVVLERCVYSDYIFADAMTKMGYFTRGMKSDYDEVRLNSLHDVVFKPTLVIYLDVEVDTILERIKKRNIDYEVNSKVLNKEYLGAIEHTYKNEYLKFISTHSEMVIYDWNNYGDVEEVANDIEKIKFEKYDKYDLKLKEWRNEEPYDWDERRLLYTNNRLGILQNAFNVPRFDVPEILVDGHDTRKMQDIILQIPEFRYLKGFNPFVDSGLTFKVRGGLNYWEKQKLRLFGGFV